MSTDARLQSLEAALIARMDGHKTRRILWQVEGARPVPFSEQAYREVSRYERNGETWVHYELREPAYARACEESASYYRR